MIRIRLDAVRRKELAAGIKKGYIYFDTIPELATKVAPMWIDLYERFGDEVRELYRLDIDTRAMKLAALGGLATGLLIIPDEAINAVEERNKKNPFLELMKSCTDEN